jgi:dipeptidyl aminopeptidase/acylaminoacyl peptidase
MHLASGKKSSVVNTVDIEASIERVWRSCTDVESWPLIFAGVTDVHRTEVGVNEIVMDMTVSNDLGVNEVRSHRWYRPDQFRIDFRMVTLPAAIAAMTGSWAVEATESGATLTIVHTFTAREDGDESEAELAVTLGRNTETVLTELRKWLEDDRDIATGEAAGSLGTGRSTDTESGIPRETFENCELFFTRLGLAGLDWGDITMVLKDLQKDGTHKDWVDWHRRWSALGEHYEVREAESAAAGFLETARVANLKAAACHHFAEFFYFDNPEAKWKSRDRVTEVFERGIPYMRETVRRLDMFHDGQDVPGYLITPPGDGPWPCVMLINGLDAAKEVELYAFAREFIARGMGAVVFDGPGQGVHIGRTPMVIDFERVVGSVMEHVARLPEVDEKRMGILGVSFGGYLAARAAASVPGFRACVNLSSGYDHDNYPNVNEVVKKDFRFVFGMKDDASMEELARTWLNLRDIPPLEIPLLAVHAEHDTIIPFDSCERMLDWAAGKTELMRYPGERHVATNYFGDFIPRFCDWMSEHLEVVGR